MNTPIIGFVFLVFCTGNVAAQQLLQQSTTLTADTIRLVFCDVDRQDYSSARKKLESLPESDQKNALVRKLLVAVLVRMIRKDDNTPENLALVRKTIEGYEQLLKDLEFTTEERQQIDSSLLDLHKQLGEEELKEGVADAC